MLERFTARCEAAFISFNHFVGECDKGLLFDDLVKLQVKAPISRNLQNESY